MAKSDLDRDSLKIGDYVVFNDAQLGCFLSVEGILLEDLVGVDTITSLHDAIFCVHLQRQYSASRELNAFLEKYNMDVKNIVEESELRYLQALERGMENENKLNDNYMKKKLGQVVLFGDIIQLFHVKSGKYLQVIPGKLAKDERENVRVGLDVNGNAFSWLQVCPRFKIDKDGDRILSNIEVHLKVAERSNEYIHSAEREPEPDQEREVNCSLETTSWRLNIFQSSTDTIDKTLLLASQLVYIHDPETRANLALSEKKIEDLNEEEDNKVNKFDSSKVLGDQGEGEDQFEDESEEEEDKIVLRPSTSQHIDSNFLWILESSSILSGGPIKWKTDQVRFKHLNSGLYLSQDVKHSLSADGSITNKTWMYTTTTDTTTSKTLFNISELNSTAKFLCSGKASQIGQSGVWMERGPILPDSLYSYKLQGTKDKAAAVNLVVNYYFGHGIGLTSDEPASSSGSSKDSTDDEESEGSSTAKVLAPSSPLDVFAGLSARNYLLKYCNMTVLSTSANTIWPTANRSDMDLFKMIVAKTVIFTQGFAMSATNVKIGIDKSDLELRKRRQNLLREQSTLEIVLRLINKLVPLSEAAVERPTAANVDSSFLTKMGRAVLEQCFTVLYNAIQDNQENQMYVADFMPVLLAHLNTQPIAVKCVTEMLSKNIELQETKIGTREIQIFVDKLRSSKMNAMYLQLLQACCSCEGAGVDGNQCKVANMLFDGDYSDIIVTLEANYNRRRKAQWGDDKVLYLSPPGGSAAVVHGVELFTQGLPHLLLRWQRHGDQMSASIEEVFAVATPALTQQHVLSPLSPPPISSPGEEMGELLSPGSAAVSFKKSISFKNRGASQESLLRVGNYFVAELFLGAEMCMDRNYVAINRLKELFTYEMLVAILAMEGLTSNVKSAAVRLLMCLHVDRDPQAASKIPLLTRTWSDIKKNPEPQLPYVDPSRRYDFGLIQQIISEHIKSMSGNRWDDLSRHMLKMLRTLVQFNFYGTNERMRDVIAPLIRALDRRRVDLSHHEHEIGMSVKISTGSSTEGGGTMMGEAPGGEVPQIDSAHDSFEESEMGNESYGIEDDRMSEVSSQADLRSSTKATARRAQYEQLLEFIDSYNFFLMMMLLVLVDIGVDIYHLTANMSFEIPSTIFIIEAATMLVFAFEIAARTLCLYKIEGNVTGMYLDIYNMCDIIAVALNIAFLIVTPIINTGAGFVIALRFVKVYRMLQLNGARIVAGTEEDVKLDSYKVTARYSIAPIHELETMVEVVDILAFMQRLIEDRNISLAMHYFYAWENGTDRRSPAELFEQVVSDSKELSLNLAGFDDIMLDVLMFVHMPLVQSTLEVLMAHHSMRKTLLNNVQKVQLLASSKREKQYREVKTMLQELESNAETHELWGELESDEDRETNVRTKEILQKLIAICRVRHFVLEFDEDFMADAQIQDLYRNLGCFEICMKVMGLLDSVEEDEDGNLSEVALNTRDLCLQCNTLLYWFLLGNPLNQEQGYGELSFFLDSLDDEINSHLVIGAIFKNNEALMRLVPHSHLDDLVERILKNGKSHHYLALFASISNVGERNIVENQFQIVKILTSPGRLQNIACFFCPVDHPDYEEKRQLMEPFLNSNEDLTLDDLPPLLAYHLMFLEVLSDCTVGRLNITTVEAKVQSVFNYVDILQSILDPGTIIFTQIRLSMFFYNSIIEVELKIPGLEQSAYIWELLQTYINVLGYAKDELRQVEKSGWDSPEVSRQKIEYIIVCILITGGFFSRYYDSNTFRFTESGHSIPNSDKVQISLLQVNELIKSLFDKVKDVYDLDSPRLSDEMKEQIFETLVSLNKSASRIIVNNLLPTNKKLQVTTNSESMNGEAKLIQKFQSFHECITENDAVMEKCENESVNFINLLEALPSITEKVDADVRYETLIRKLVQHIRDNFQYVNGQKRLDARVTKTSTWIIRSFRTMIENKMGMSIYERDDDGGEEEDQMAAPVVNALNSCGATALCLDLIADGIDEGLQLEAVKLGVGLLFKEGGALEVQTIMHTHLSKTKSELFFKQVRLTLQKLQAWHTWNGEIILGEDEEPSPPDEILIVRFLQLMCEGHFLPNQDIMREQPNNSVSYNLLDDFVAYFNCLSRLPCRTSTSAGIRLSATILEVIQGPCEGNQAHFALNTELIETLNRINRAKMSGDCVEEEEIELKKTSIDIFQGLLEGQGEKSVVYERVLSVIHLDIIQMMSKGATAPEPVGKDGKVMLPKEPTEEQEILQTECIVLLQMLCNFKPSLYEELGISKNIDDIVGSGTAMIEVVWRGDIHRRFFHVPTVCDFLAKSSKDALVENVDRSNSENKLIDFLARSHDLYREVKHQQLLTEMNLSRVFCLEVQDLATWTTFGAAVMINILFIAFYNYNAGDDRPSVTSTTALSVIDAFNMFQNIVGAFVIILNVVVRSPVIYQSHMAAGVDQYRTMLYTASDPKTLYFCAYLVLSLLGLLAADYYLPFLLLDIVAKNATTRDVLNAVVIPRKQLGMTVVLAIFVTYIFAYFIFKYYRDDLGGLMGDGVYPGDNDCKNLWGCFKFVLCYGVRQGGGVGEMLKLSIGPRWLIDATYFIVLIVMMLNIIFGIIIDTFSSLRADKNIRTEDTVSVCFICGINNQVFDRASDEPDGFKTHIKLDHNMWNYLYFIFMLWEQDKDDDDGLEQYVRRAIEANEITWFPLNKAIRLEQAATEEEITLRELSSEIQAFEATLGRKILQFQSEMGSILDTVSLATKLEHAKGTVKDGIAGYIRRSMIVAAPVDDPAEMSVMGGGSSNALLDTIDEDGTLADENSLEMDDGSATSGHGLGPVHETGSDDEDSDTSSIGMDEAIERNTRYNSSSSRQQQRRASKEKEESNEESKAEAVVQEELARFPGSSDEMDVNDIVGGPAVLIKERSNAFWDMDGQSSAPCTPGTAPSRLATPLDGTDPSPPTSQQRSRAGTVETIPEGDHENQATTSDDATANANPVILTAATETDLGHTDQDPPQQPVVAEHRPSMSQPAIESEDIRPDTAAMVFDVLDTQATEESALENNTRTDVDQQDGEVLAPTEAPVEETEVKDQEPTEAPVEETEAKDQEPTEAPVEETDATDQEPTEAPVEETDVTDQEPTEAPVEETEAKDQEPTEAPIEETDATEAEGLPQSGAAEEAGTGEDVEETSHPDEEGFGDTSQAVEQQVEEGQEEGVRQGGDEEGMVDHLEEEEGAVGGDGEQEGGDEEGFMPEIQSPGMDAVGYLAGDSFRVTHVVDADSVTHSSEVLESSLGGDSPRLDADWARESVSATGSVAADPEHATDASAGVETEDGAEETGTSAGIASLEADTPVDTAEDNQQISAPATAPPAAEAVLSTTVEQRTAGESDQEDEIDFGAIDSDLEK